jgi:hypothetical protein
VVPETWESLRLKESAGSLATGKDYSTHTQESVQRKTVEKPSLIYLLIFSEKLQEIKGG